MIKSKSVKFLIVALFSIFNFQFLIVSAHPLDISSTFFTIKGNNANVTTYFHTYEIEYLLNSKEKYPKTIKDYYNNKETIIQYLQQNTRLYNENEICDIKGIDLPERPDYEVLTKGVETNYNFECKNTIKNLKIEIKFFTNFQLQTNKVTVYSLNNGIENITPVANKVLTSKIDSYSIDLTDSRPTKAKDTDGDGLSDEEELIYKTDPNKIDTDGDNYTDYEEVVGGWNPVNTDIGPGQKYRESMPLSTIDNVNANLQGQTQQLHDIKSKEEGLMNSGYGMGYLQKVLKEINEYIDKTSSKNFLYILAIVVVLGFIHAIGPGHSKSLLVSYIVDKNKGFVQGLGFITIFTVTHLIDIIVLFLVSKFIFKIYDISNYMLYIQRFSLSILFIFSIYLIYRSRKSLKNKNMEKSSTQKDLKGNILLGLVAGLAPCTFGWSIFLLLFSLGSLDLILPIIFALGLGIFVCLLGILIITVMVRDKAYVRMGGFANYSSMVSSIILLFLSIYLFSALI